MTKNLRLRAIGMLVLSAILFVMPIGAIFANSSMTASVMAAEENDGGSTDESGNASDNETNEETGEKDENGSDESGDASGNEDGSASENENGEGGEGETEEPVKLTCTCTEHCAGIYSYNANCEACAADYKNCEYVNPNVTITITAPDGWSNDKAKITIAVRDAKNTGNFEIVKIEAKIGQNGSWQDITEDKYIEITENCSVYVQVTDQNGKVYSKNRSIRCFDRTNPTLNAAVSNGLLTVVGHDNDSGIKAFYVNGYEFTEFTNNTLNIRLQQFDTGYEYFTVQAMDKAGNMSEVYKTKNPYYDDDPSDDDDKGASTLPTNATASNPSHATAEVTEHTKTDSQGNTTYSSKQEQEKHQSMAEADAAEEAEKQGDSDEERAETGKEFYTIQTQSEKVFYLIIDRDGEEERVYFLTEIDENDLMNTTSNNSETLPKNSAALESAIPTNDAALNNNNVESEVTVSDGVVSENDATEETEEEQPEEEEPVVEEPKTQSSMATYLIIGIIGAGAIGAWYYLKMVKGKKEDFLDEDDEEDDEEEIYESDDDDENDGDDFFKMDDNLPVTPIDDIEDDVADTIDEE